MANYTILLIDYEPRSIERFREPLTEAGYSVEVATDGLTGIEAFHRLSPDMVLVEAMIPKKHGFEVCQELKRTPHGRRTPVLITTGVYKGRKYRTQALHIYGCDEYIEKPIAPEQLLAVVGKFFGPAAAAAPAPALEPRTATPVEATVAAISEGVARTGVAVSTSLEPPPSRPSPSKTIPSSLAKDFTEEEIMARLDAILPGGDFAQPPESEIAEMTIVSAPEPAPAPPTLSSVEAVESEDPFAQMQAELSAELGSMATALALDPAPVFEAEQQSIPSDQVVSPSLLEALPVPEIELPPPQAVPEAAHVEPEPITETPTTDPPGQLVNFDVKRSRRKRGGKKGAPHTAASLVPETPSAPAIEPPRASTQPPVETAPPLEVLTLPAGTLVESDLADSATRKGVPVWIWAALAAIVLVAVCLVALRGHPAPSETGSLAPSDTGRESSDPGVAASDAIPLASADSGSSSLVLNSINSPERSPRTPGPTPKSSSSSAPAAAEIAPGERPQPPKPTSTIPPPPGAVASAKPAIPGKRPAVITDAPFPGPLEDDRSKLAAPESAPAASVDATVTGVESISEGSAQHLAASIAPGTLVSADELDTAPVSLSRKLPIYSLQARQMRVEGIVVMKVLVNENGTVDEVALVSGVPGADLNNAAMRAAKAWTYRPATKGGVPVKVWKIEQVAFKL